MNALFRFLLFLSSYLPAFVVLAILFWNRQRGIAYGAVSLGILGIAALLVWLHVLRRRIQSQTETVSQCRRNDTEAMTYVLSYLVPFVGGVIKGGEAAVAFAFFFLVIGILYANSNLVHINPMLNLFGYRIYEAKVGGDSYVLVSRKRVLADEKVDVVRIGDEIFLEVK